MNRRKFTKLGILSTGALFLPVSGISSNENSIYGGDERLFLNSNDIAGIKSNISKYDWAKRRFEVLKRNASTTEEEFYRQAWKGDWRQWTTGQYLKYIAIYYRLTGEETNLIQIKEHLTNEFKLDQIEIPFNKLGLPVSKEIWSWGMSRANYFWAWDLVKNHPLMSSIKDALMIRFKEITRQYFQYEDNFIGRLGNTQFWGIAVMGVMGFLTSNEEAIDRSINGKFGLKSALENKLRDRMFWPEPTSYSLHYVLCAMSLLAEAARVNKYEDLYHYVSPRGGSMKGIIDGLFELCYPQGLVASNGDGAYRAVRNSNREIVRNEVSGGYLFNDPSDRVVNKFEIFYKAYKDPKYAWAINRQKDRFCMDVTVWGDNTLTYGIPLENEVVPSFKSAVFQEYGLALISSIEGKEYWDGKNNVLHIRNGNTIQYHGHDDPFHIDLFVNGKMIYLDWDPGWNYLAPRPSRGNRNKTPLSHYSLGHNTVVVDKKGPDKKRYQLPQSADEINDIVFSDIEGSGRMKTISLEGSIYKGVTQRRTLGLTDDYLIDVFECSSDEVHTYDYILHDEDDLIFDTPIELSEYNNFSEDYNLAPVDSESKSDGNEWLRKGERGIANKEWEAYFGTKSEKRVKIYFGPEAGTEVFKTNTPLDVGSGWDNTSENIKKMSKPVLIVRRKCSSTKFILVHQLRKLDQPYKVEFGNDSIHISGEGFDENILYADRKLTLKL